MDAVKTRFTPEEYLEQEQRAEFKGEYRNGETVSIPGGTPHDNRLVEIFTEIVTTTLKTRISKLSLMKRSLPI
ncbi:MAG: hypothetical protein ACRCYY_09000 [Trueperaceae bacterium]